MKRIILIILVLLLVFAGIPITTSSAFVDGSFQFEMNGDGSSCVLTKCLIGGNVTILDTATVLVRGYRTTHSHGEAQQ